eukprot:617847-Amphidinium_carterae.1
MQCSPVFLQLPSSALVCSCLLAEDMRAGKSREELRICGNRKDEQERARASKTKQDQTGANHKPEQASKEQAKQARSGIAHESRQEQATAP